MKRREVDDAMVARGIAAARDANKPYASAFSPEFIRAILDGALNPLADPEIVVTEEMRNAGARAYHDWLDGDNSKSWEGTVYRAMRALEPPICEHAWQSTFENRVCVKCNKVERLAGGAR